MALNGNTLKGLIKAAVDSIDVENGEITNDDVLQAFADAIVQHITTDGKVIIAGGSLAGTYDIT